MSAISLRSLSQGSRTGGLFDAKLTSIVAYMKGVCHASYTTIRKYLRDIIGIKVSRGYLKKVLEKVSDSLFIPYGELRSALPLQSGLNIDESSLQERMRELFALIHSRELYSPEDFATRMLAKKNQILRRAKENVPKGVRRRI